MMYIFPALISAATMSNMTVLDTAGQNDLDMSSKVTYPISFQVKIAALWVNTSLNLTHFQKITLQKDIYHVNFSTCLDLVTSTDFNFNMKINCVMTY